MNDNSIKYEDKYINQDFFQEIKKFLEIAKNNQNNKQKIIIGKVSERLAECAKENNFNIENFNHNLDISGIRHAFKHHGSCNETENNQIPITEADIKKIPYIIYNYDKVTFGTKDNKGTNIIKYQKQMSNREIYYLEEIRTGKKTLTIKTMYIKSR